MQYVEEKQLSKDKLKQKLLHYTSKAISCFKMIEAGDRVMLCLSGGKDSFTLLSLLLHLQAKKNYAFKVFAFILDQGQPGWDDSKLRAYLESKNVEHEIYKQDTYSIVTDKLPATKTYCSLCSRLRRGVIYSYAKKHNFNKIALGHHRDDLIQTLLMSIFFNGEVCSMPPKLLTNDKKHIVIRPMVYCQEKDIAAFARLQNYPIIPCQLCGSQKNLSRKKVATLIEKLALENPKIPSNILHALGNIKPSQLMDQNLWDFAKLTID